jgi:hypothetical protein
MDYEQREEDGSERHYRGWEGGTEFIIGLKVPRG